MAFIKRNKLWLFLLTFTLILFLGIFSLFRAAAKGDLQNKTVLSLAKKVHHQFKQPSPIKIGIINDVKCYGKPDEDDPDAVKELNWRCSEPLESMVWKMNNEFQPDLVVENGSLIKGKGFEPETTLNLTKGIIERFKAPVFYNLGEEEVRNFSKERWRELMQAENDYYYIDQGNYRLIFLDSNHLELESGEVVDSSPGNISHSGLLDQDQWQWLEDALKTAGFKEKIVFVYHPPISTDLDSQGILFKDGEKLRELLVEHQVRAVFSGFVNRFCRQKYQGVEYITLQGPWDSNGKLKEDFKRKNGGIFSEITLDEDEIKVLVNYRRGRGAGYYNFDLTPNGFSCLDGFTLRQKYQEMLAID